MSENVVCQKYFIISCHCKFRNMIWKDAVPWHDDDNINVKKKDRDIWQMLRSLEKSSLWGLDQILQMGEFEKLILQRLQIYLKYLYKSVKNWSTTYCRAFKILFLITKEIDNFLQKHIGISHKSHTNEQLRGPILLCCLVLFNIEVVIIRDGRPAPRGGGVPRPAPHCGEGGLPHPAPSCKNYQNRGEVAGQNKGPNLKFLQ